MRIKKTEEIPINEWPMRKQEVETSVGDSLISSGGRNINIGWHTRVDHEDGHRVRKMVCIGIAFNDETV